MRAGDVLAMTKDEAPTDELVRAFVSRHQRRAPVYPEREEPSPPLTAKPFDPKKYDHVRTPYGDDKD